MFQSDVIDGQPTDGSPDNTYPQEFIKRVVAVTPDNLKLHAALAEQRTADVDELFPQVLAQVPHSSVLRTLFTEHCTLVGLAMQNAEEMRTTLHDAIRRV